MTVVFRGKVINDFSISSSEHVSLFLSCYLQCALLVEAHTGEAYGGLISRWREGKSFLQGSVLTAAKIVIALETSNWLKCTKCHA